EKFSIYSLSLIILSIAAIVMGLFPDFIISSTEYYVASFLNITEFKKLPAFEIPWPTLVLIPYIGAFVIYFAGKFSENFRNLLATCISALTLYYVFEHTNFDELSKIFTFIMAGIGLIITIYSIDYFKGKEYANRYFFFLFLMQGALLGVTTSDDFASFYLFWELMTFTSYLLVIHEQTQKALKAGFKYFIMCTSGAYIMLFAILTLHAELGSFDFNIISQNLHLLSPTLLFSLLIMFIIGFGVKAGLVPMHSWLPDAHPVAPSSISAPMSGILTKAGIYGLILVVSLVFGNELVASLGVTAGFSTIGLIISFLGAITLLYGEFMALVQKDIKRMLAYSTMAQIGEIVITLGVGTYLSLVGSLYHVLNHAIMKNLLFLAVGALIYRLKSQKIEKFKGIGTQMPITSLFFGVGILAIMGLPPFNGFISKFLMLYANVQAGHTELAALILFGSVVGGFYYVRLLRIIFFEKYEGPELKEAPLSMLIPLGILTSLIVINGLYPQAGFYLVKPAVDYIALKSNLLVVDIPNLSFDWPLMVIIPALGALVTFILGKKSARVAGICAVATMSLTLLVIVLDFEKYDLFSFSFAFLIAFIGVLNLIYTIGYMDHHGHPQNRFYMFFLLMIAGLLGVAVSDNLYSFFVFWEIMSSWTLYFVIIHEQTPKALKEGFKYFSFNYIGASLMFLGVVILSVKAGTFEMSKLADGLSDMPLLYAGLSILLILVGFVMKAAMLPVRIDYQMHPVSAPTPVSGYISSVLLKSAPFGIVKLFFVFGGITVLSKFGFNGDLATPMYILAWISGITIFVAALLALLQSSMKLLLIYHTVSQMGYIILGISLGSSLGLAGGLAHLVNHMIFKDLLFLVAGAIMLKTGVDTLDKLGGLGKKMPITFAVFAIAALSIAGIPPFNGFTSKWIIYQASMEQGYVFLALLSLVSSVLTLASFMKFLHSAFLGQLPKDLENVSEAPWTMLVPMIILAFICILLGVFPGLLLSVVAQIESLFGMTPISTSLFGIDSGMGYWHAGVITLLLVGSLFIGAGFYFIGNRNIRYTKIHTCGISDLTPEEIHVNSHNLYESPKKLIKQGIKGLKKIVNFNRGVN
ncbi:MAG: formate hydrogenlyase subunit 3/multisubunit Na+/H+ antiporter MnhD subunit, partial [Sulfurimonas sp.]